MARHAHGETRVEGAQQDALVGLVAREGGEQRVGQERAVPPVRRRTRFAFGLQHGEVDGRDQGVREDAVVDFKERAPVHVVAPEDLLRATPEVFLEIARVDAVIDDAIGGQSRRDERRLDAVL